MNLPFLAPMGCPPGVDPAEWREAVAARVEELQDAMQALIASLDHMEGDPDLEPSIVGGVEFRDGAMVDVTDDREGDDVLDEGEHSLGWTLATRQGGRKWLALDYNGGDREAEHDGREPDEDREPSIGGGWVAGRYVDDLEDVNEDGGDVNDESHDAPGQHVPGGGYHT